MPDRVIHVEAGDEKSVLICFARDFLLNPAAISAQASVVMK
jgi:hypothetical protein